MSEDLLRQKIADLEAHLARVEHDLRLEREARMAYFHERQATAAALGQIQDLLDDALARLQPLVAK